MCQVLEIDWKEAFYLESRESSPQPDRNRIPGRPIVVIPASTSRDLAEIFLPAKPIWGFPLQESAAPIQIPQSSASRILSVTLELVLAIRERSSL
jgi:hypothetical protein